MSIGRRIARERQHRGWSQQQLAERSRLSRSTVSSAELGAHATTLATLEAIAAGFGLDFDQLYCPGGTGRVASPVAPWPADPCDCLTRHYHLTTQQALALHRFLTHLAPRATLDP